MKESKEEASANAPAENFQIKESNPLEVCNKFRARVVCFISDIEKLLRNPSLQDDLTYLDKISEDIVALESLTSCTGCCSENVIEAGLLIHNIITDKIELKISPKITSSTLELAQNYRKDKSQKEAFSKMLSNYLKERELTESFVRQLKVLAFDVDSNFG